MARLRALLAFASLCAPATASTWVVDDDGGPGVHFTSIQDAIDFASPGDVLLVQTGEYAGFALDKPLSILGQGPQVDFNGPMVVAGIPAGGRVALVRLRRFGFSHLRIEACAGTVIGDDLTGSGYLHAVDSADVRLRRLGAGVELAASGSRVELTQSTLVGFSTNSCFCCPAGYVEAGETCVSAGSGEVHLALVSAQGGSGGDISCGDTGMCGDGAGDGGSGLRLWGTARALVSGLPSQVYSGGTGGEASGGCQQFPDGEDGAGIRMGAGDQLRWSGVSLASLSNLGGAVETPALADPTMRLLDEPTPGANLTFRVDAPPGSDVDVVLGRNPVVVDVPGLEEDVLTTTNRVFHLGIVPPEGVVSLNFPTSAAWPKGFVLVFQAVATYPDASVRRSHSVPVVFR